MPAAYSIDLRERAVRLSQELGVAETALVLVVAPATIKRWRARALKGNLAASPMGGDRRSLARNEADVCVVKETVAEKPDRTLDELVRAAKGLSRTVSRSAMARLLTSLGFTLKKKVIVATERFTQRVEDARRSFAEVVGKLGPDSLVFIDESGVTTSMTRTHARGIKGKRVHGRAPRNRGNVTTLIGALARDGIRALMTIEAATTGEVFQAYVQHFLAPTLKRGDVVVLDNAAVHKSAAVRKLIEAAGASVLFLPPYSPDLNPIEMTWSKLKSILRKLEARTRDTLTVAVGQAMEAVTTKDVAGWFEAAGITGST